MTTFNRRTLLAGSGALAASTMLSSRDAQAQSGTRLRAYWWGNPERDRRTRAALDAYQARAAGVQVSSESVGWGDYWTKLATQTAGGLLQLQRSLRNAGAPIDDSPWQEHQHIGQ